MKKEYPMWHRRFTRARNLLGEACEEMDQACYEDPKNYTFHGLYNQMHDLMNRVMKQQDKNIERGKKEGWLK